MKLAEELIEQVDKKVRLFQKQYKKDQEAKRNEMIEKARVYAEELLSHLEEDLRNAAKDGSLSLSLPTGLNYDYITYANTHQISSWLREQGFRIHDYRTNYQDLDYPDHYVFEACWNKNCNYCKGNRMVTIGDEMKDSKFELVLSMNQIELQEQFENDYDRPFSMATGEEVRGLIRDYGSQESFTAPVSFKDRVG